MFPYSNNFPSGSNRPATGQVTKTSYQTTTVNGVTTTVQTTTTTNGDTTSKTTTTYSGNPPPYSSHIPSSNFPSTNIFPSSSPFTTQGSNNFGFPDKTFGHGFGAPSHQGSLNPGYGTPSYQGSLNPGYGTPSYQTTYQQPTQQTNPYSKPAASPRAGGTNINLNTFSDSPIGGYKPSASPRNNPSNFGAYKPTSNADSPHNRPHTTTYHNSPSFQTASPDNRGATKPTTSPGTNVGPAINLNAFTDNYIGTYKPVASPSNRAGTVPTNNYNYSTYQTTSPDNTTKYTTDAYVPQNPYKPAGGSPNQYGTQNTQQYTPSGGDPFTGMGDVTTSVVYTKPKKDEASPPKPNFEFKSENDPFTCGRTDLTTSMVYKPSNGSNPTEEDGMRMSLITSTVTKNPYYYHSDTATKLDDKNKPQNYKAENDDATEEQRLSKVFSFFNQPGSELTGFITFLGKLKIAGDKYIDNDFPANINSLIGTNHMRRGEWGSYIWLRPEEFYGKDVDVFVGGIDPSDIKQGQLGDCYFLSTIASLAEWPKRIEKLFVTKKANSCGAYGVKICDMGEWKEVAIDDYFPCDKYSRKPVFTKGNGNELWVLILEKVWAKIYGSYDAIEAGLARECLHDFTGAPTKFYLTDRRDEWEMIWRKLVKGEKKHFAMTCGAGDFFSQSTVNMVNSKGIVSSHAYSLLSVHEVDTYRGQARLVKLRNPWAKTEWNGAWGDSCPNWTPELKRKLNLEKKDDGIFFMAYEDFMKYFADIQICYVYDDYKYSAKRVTATHRRATYFKIKIDTPGKYYLTINQESKRKNTQNYGFKYTTAFMVVAKSLGNQQYQYVTGNNRADREVWARGYLTPGEYVVYAKLPWANGKSSDFVLSSYGPSEAKIEVVSKQSLGNFLESTFMSVARTSKKAMNYAREGEPNCSSVVDISKDGFIYCYYKNNSTRTLETEIYFKEFNGLKLRKPFRGRTYKIQVPPQQEKIVLVKVLPNQDVRQVLAEKVKFIKDEPGKANSSPYGGNVGNTQYYTPSTPSSGYTGYGTNPSTPSAGYTGYGTNAYKPSYY